MIGRRDFLATIPDRNNNRKLFRGIIYSGGKMAATNGGYYCGISEPYSKGSEGKVYSVDGSKIEVEPRELVEMKYRLSEYAKNISHSNTVDYGQLSAIVDSEYNNIKVGGYIFNKKIFKWLLSASDTFDIEIYHVTNFKHIGALYGTNSADGTVVLVACLDPSELGKDKTIVDIKTLDI